MILKHPYYNIPENTPDKILQIIEELQRLELLQELLLDKLNSYFYDEEEDGESVDIYNLVYNVNKYYGH